MQELLEEIEFARQTRSIPATIIDFRHLDNGRYKDVLKHWILNYVTLHDYEVEIYLGMIDK